MQSGSGNDSVMSKPAYLVVDARVTDPVRIVQYLELTSVAVARYGGRYLVRGGVVESLEGDWRPERLVIVQFDSAAAVRRFYDSPEYRATRRARGCGGVRRAGRRGLLTVCRTQASRMRAGVDGKLETGVEGFC